jgi:hypothetical protein
VDRVLVFDSRESWMAPSKAERHTEELGDTKIAVAKASAG